MQIAQLVVTAIATLTWPLVVLSLLFYFGRDFRDFVRNANEFRVKIAGLEGTLTRHLESAAALGAAAANKGTDGRNSGGSGLAEAQLRQIAETVSEATKPTSAKRLSESDVLWVDDTPGNNLYERTALQALGIASTISDSTDDALYKVRLRRYEAIISDMGRPGDPQAGYTLLEQLRKEGISAPFIIYSGSNLPEHKALAREKGAFGSTNNPQELFQLVISAILSDLSTGTGK